MALIPAVLLLAFYISLAVTVASSVSRTPCGTFVSTGSGRCQRLRQSRSGVVQKMGGETGRRERKAKERRREYEHRRDEWLGRYGTVQALRNTFGAGPPFGDLSPQQTRSLYHTLLPRSLVGLYEMGLMNAEELAPLAYEARIAAKEYARSRCKLTGRIVTAAFDQYRNLRDRGRFATGSSNLSWEEIWQKYEGQIVQEECAEALNGTLCNTELDDETLTKRIYLRILERSCATNQAFDSLFLKEDGGSGDLAMIASQLETDVRSILLRPKESAKVIEEEEKAKKKQLKTEKKEKKRLEKAGKKDEKQQEKIGRKEEKRRRRLEEKERDEMIERASYAIAVERDSEAPTYSQRAQVLRILAGTRRKFRRLQGNSTQT